MRDEFATVLKDAMRAKDTRRISTIRLIQTAIKDRDIANRGQGKDPVNNDEIMQILAKMIKQREESARIYDEGGRPELASRSARKSSSSPPSCRHSCRRTKSARSARASLPRSARRGFATWAR